MSAVTDSEKDRPLAKPAGATGPTPPPVPAEPLPAETRRLPKAASRPAPVLAILRARWPWLVVATLLGTLAGLFLGGSPSYQATATLRLSTINDPNRVKQVGQTYERVAAFPGVVEIAVAALRDAKNADVPAALRSLPADTLSARIGPNVKGAWTVDTDLVDITVKDPIAGNALAEANAIADAVVRYGEQQRDVRVSEISRGITSLIQKQQLGGSGSPNGTAETARLTQIGTQTGTEQIGAYVDAASVSVSSPAQQAVAAGASRPVSAGLGAMGGLLLGGLGALVLGAGRRRVRTPAELRSLAPELNLRATTQAGEVAGRLLESGHSTLVVLSLPSTPSSASRFAAAVANHLRTHGSSVTLVNAIALESGDATSMSLPDEVWVLRRDIRQDVKSYFSTDVLVVACTAEPEAVGLISGQSDLMAVIVAKEGRSTLQQIWDTVGAVESADPIVVLAP
jgi:capsular polysaccharide biosynthesis protein